MSPLVVTIAKRQVPDTKKWSVYELPALDREIGPPLLHKAERGEVNTISHSCSIP